MSKKRKKHREEFYEPELEFKPRPDERPTVTYSKEEVAALMREYLERTKRPPPSST